MRLQVPIELKMQCVRLIQQGNTIEKVYDYFYKEFPECDIDKEHFRKRLNAWQKKEYPDEITLRNGTYKNFTPHGATVQVNSDGIITQAWIKQNSNIVSPEEFIKIIKKNRIEKFSLEKKQNENSITLASDMLEIPLFDMHWGISYYENYETVLAEIIKLVSSKQWDKIIIPFGQDYFHNDSIINGLTTRGTCIEKVDMVRAVKDGQQFMYAIIDAALENAEEVKVIELLSTNAWLTEPFTVKSIPVIEIEPVLMLMLLLDAVMFPLLKYKPFETPELVPDIDIVLLLTVFGVVAFPS